MQLTQESSKPKLQVTGSSFAVGLESHSAQLDQEERKQWDSGPQENRRFDRIHDMRGISGEKDEWACLIELMEYLQGHSKSGEQKER